MRSGCSEPCPGAARQGLQRGSARRHSVPKTAVGAPWKAASTPMGGDRSGAGRSGDSRGSSQRKEGSFEE